MITLRYKKNLYPLDIIKKAAFVFTEYAYILLDEEDDSYIVYLNPKEGEMNEEQTEGEFNNELLAQLVREIVSEKTRGLRELIYNRALSSSLILQDEHLFESLEIESKSNISNVIKDWFDANED